MLVSASDLLAASTSPVIGRRGDLAEKLRVLGSLADGSHFQRLMEVGGRFERTFEMEAEAGAFAVAFVASAIFACVQGAARRRRRERLGAEAFLLAATLGVTAGTLALPGAVRAHHLMNALPFPQLLVACAGVACWRGLPRRRGAWVVRAGLVLAAAALLGGNAARIRDTYALVAATGGRGWWSDALREPAAELEADPRRRGVSLDWSFHEPLLFLTRRARLVEPIWGIRAAASAEGEWRFPGEAGDVYFVHDREWDLFGFGPGFLGAARALAERRPDALEVRAHRDREGAVAFHTVRLAVDHELAFRRIFRIRLRDEIPGPERTE
jgi:hypothetical protein